MEPPKIRVVVESTIKVNGLGLGVKIGRYTEETAGGLACVGGPQTFTCSGSTL